MIVDGMDEVMPGNQNAKAAIDAALWDLRGKALESPVAVLLGGVKEQELNVVRPIAWDTPQNMAEEAAAAADRGFRRFSLDLGEDTAEDAARATAVAARSGTGQTL